MNGTINLKKLSTKMLDAISTLNTRVDAVPDQIKNNNRQMLATVEQNAEASSRAYAAGEYLAVNGKLYKALNDIAQGDALQDNVNIEWVRLGDEVNKLRGDLKTGAWRDVANDLNTATAGTDVLDAYQGKLLNDSISALTNRVAKIENRQVLVSSANVDNPKYNNYFGGAQVTLPANSGRWLILGHISNNQGTTTLQLCYFLSSIEGGFYQFDSRSRASGGGGVTSYAYCLNSNVNRVVAVRSYHYENINPIRYYTNIMAFNLG